MEKNWICIYTTDKMYQCEIAKDQLKENNIQSVIINKQDSAYIIIGEIELYVAKESAFKAKQIIEKLRL